jgi:hypothetical protein
MPRCMICERKADKLIKYEFTEACEMVEVCEDCDKEAQEVFANIYEWAQKRLAVEIQRGRESCLFGVPKFVSSADQKPEKLE